MNKSDLLKFFAGFFFASIIIHLVILFSGVMPFALKGFVFDYSFWTMGIVSSCFFVVACSYIGWERKEANRISISILVFLISIVSTNGFYFFDSKEFAFNSYNASAMDITNEKSQTKNSAKDSADEINFTYAHSLGGEKNDYGKSAAIDKDNNTYITGAFSGIINLNPDGKFEKTSLGGIGETTDIYVAKYDRKGGFISGFTIGSVGSDSPTLIKTDKDGNLYLAGHIGGSADFDPSEKEYILDAGIGQDGFIAKYDSSGNLIWAKKIGNAETIPFITDDIRFEEVADFTFDKDGNIYIVGYFEGTIEFKDIDGNAISFASSTPKKSRDIFLAKYDKDGNYSKGFALTGEGRKEPKGIVIDEENNIYLSGIFNSKIIFDNANPKKITYTFGGFDLFLAKYNPNLDYLWSKKWGSENNDYLGENTLAFDHDNKILLAGSIGGYVNFQGIKISNKGLEDIFWMKTDKEGQIEYAYSVGGEGSDIVDSIAIDSLNNVYLAGHFSKVVSFDQKNRTENNIAYSISSGEASDAFLAKYDSKGAFVWVNSLGGDVSLKEELQEFSSVVIDNLDYPIVTGSFCKTLDFNSTESLNLSSKGSLDALIVKYDPEGRIK